MAAVSCLGWFRARLAFVCCGLGVWMAVSTGCGSSPPRAEDIYHDPALRPGEVDAADDLESAILAQLSAEPGAGRVEIAGREVVLGATFHAASGHRCREASHGSSTRLACERESGWVYVPQVLPSLVASGAAGAGTEGPRP